jgi:SAM-dependent methyltransferase
MLKMFRAQAHAGADSTFWDQNWAAGGESSLHESERVCQMQPVFPLLARTLAPNRLFLEGGCGPAYWVKYFHERGYRALGIDFAADTVERIHERAPELDVRVGNVLALPLGDGEVHTYYSGGVVEHFEDGPAAALREARRVLARDGWFLCSVPDASPLRAVLFPTAESMRRRLDPPLAVRKVERPQPDSAPAGMQFFQYAFAERDFRAELARHGFRIEETFGYSIVWALMEVPGFQVLYQRAYDLLKRNGNGHAAQSNRAGGAGNGLTRGLRPLAKRVVLREDVTAPVFGPAIRLARQLCANMRMYVARPV